MKTAKNYSQILLILGIFAFRLFNAFSVTTYFYPDEWWQFQEPAHLAVFKFGYLTWDWRAEIRSWLFLLPAISLFTFAKSFTSGQDFIVLHSGKLIMAANQTIVDYFTGRLAGKYFGNNIENIALLLSLTSSYHFSRSTRTISNNFEMSLCLIGLYLLPTRWNLKYFSKSLISFGLGAAGRITSIQYFAPILLFSFIFKRNWDIFFSTCLITISVAAFGIFIDCLFYQQFTITWWNFYRWNILYKISHLYGRDPWYYHLKVTVPLQLNFYLPFFAIGCIHRPWLFYIVIFPYFVANSLQTHKEVRFLSPILPLCLAYAAHGYNQLQVWMSKKKRIRGFLLKLSLVCSLLAQLPIAYFYSRIKYDGREATIDALRELVDSKSNIKRVFFYADCHSFPGPSYLHRSQVEYLFIPCHAQVFSHLFTPQELANHHKSRFESLLAEGSVDAIVAFQSEIDVQLTDYLQTRDFKICSQIIPKSIAILKYYQSSISIYCKNDL